MSRIFIFFVHWFASQSKNIKYESSLCVKLSNRDHGCSRGAPESRVPESTAQIGGNSLQSKLREIESEFKSNSSRLDKLLMKSNSSPDEVDRLKFRLIVNRNFFDQFID